jgi:hypothetical protein
MNEKQFHAESENVRSDGGGKKFMLCVARNEHVENVQHKKQIYKCCVYIKFSTPRSVIIIFVGAISFQFSLSRFSTSI